jgi:hypothetical protein
MSFPRLLVPRPAQNTKPAAGVKPAEKPLGYVVATSAPAPVEPAPKPAADAVASRQTGGFGRVAAVPPGARARPPEPPRQYREHFDRHGRPSIHPDDIPF